MLFYEKAFYFCLIGRSDECGIIQIAFLLRRLFGEDMAMVSVFPLDFPVPVKSKRFLAAEFVFIFGISINFK